MTNFNMRDWGASTGKGLGDQVIYYRRPPEGEDPGWIIWSDSISGTKLRDMIVRKFEPLFKYGTINQGAMHDRLADVVGAIWEPILKHPDGPAEFPVSQVVTYRWYNDDDCPVKGIVFPQLSGAKIREYRCPECNRAPFVDINGVGGTSSLGLHLRIMHGWDRSVLMAYGDRVGVDFNAADAGGLAVKEYSPRTAAPVQTVEVEVVNRPIIETIVAAVPSGFICPDCGTSAKSAFGLRSHRRTHKDLVPA